MLILHGIEKCVACNAAKRILTQSGIEFKEKGIGGLDLVGGLPILVNTDNGKRYNGWPGSVEKLKEVLGC